MSAAIARGFGGLGLAELADRLRDLPPLELWCVTTDEFFDGRLLPNSRRVPLPIVVRYARGRGLESETDIVVYGAGPDCPEGPLAAVKLASAGFRNARAFHPGVAGWAAAGLPFAALAQRLH